MSATAVAKTIPFNVRLPKKAIVDLAYTSRRSEVQITTGSLNDGVEATIELCIDDGRSSVEILWTLERWKSANGRYQLSKPYPAPHTDMSFEVDEIEAFATALYEAVQRARKAGYLPAVTGGAQS